MHPLDLALQLETVDAQTVRAHTSPDYANMVGPFGGTTAAQLLAAVLEHPECLGTPVAITVNFMAPVSDGEFLIRVRKTRQNRSSQHWFFELLQGDEACGNGTAVTALRRESWRSNELAFPQVPPAAEVPVTQRGELKVRWPQCYEFRFAEGNAPQFAVDPTGDLPEASSKTMAWVRDEPPRPLDFPALLAISDSFFPRIFLRRPRFTPIGTVSMSTYFHCVAADLEAVGTASILAVAQGQIFNQGYFDQTAHLWSARGQCLVTTHQMVYFKD